EARLAVPGHATRFGDARRGAEAPVVATRSLPASGRQSDDHREPRPLRALHQARERVSIAGFGGSALHDLARSGGRAAGGAEEVAPASVSGEDRATQPGRASEERSAVERVVWPLWSVRH